MQNSHINLSYILVTFNKLPYLKSALETLIPHKKEDVEIIIIDGGSTDGTPQYLQELLSRGEIDQFVSEPDKGQSHGINKGLLQARGKLLKILNDDDTYYHDEIEKCKTFMLNHPEIDALGSNGTNHHGEEYHREEDFLMWKNTPYHPFMIAEQGLILRKSSLSIFGLADTSVIFWEWEFTMRLTSGKARLAWYTGKTWKHMLNPDSISVKQAEVWRKESKELRRRYPVYSKWKHYVPKRIREFIRYFFPKKILVPAESIKTPTFLF